MTRLQCGGRMVTISLTLCLTWSSWCCNEQQNGRKLRKRLMMLKGPYIPPLVQCVIVILCDRFFCFGGVYTSDTEKPFAWNYTFIYLATMTAERLCYVLRCSSINTQRFPSLSPQLAVTPMITLPRRLLLCYLACEGEPCFRSFLYTTSSSPSCPCVAA